MFERCPHTHWRVCYKVNGAGIRMWCRQCTDCGDRVGDWLSRSSPDVLLLHDAEPFDEALQERCRAERYVRQQADWRARRNEEVQAKREQLEHEWQTRYETYRRSRQWQELRQLVFTRSKGVCEGCGRQRATQVHHLSYEHMGNEFLWELIAICRTCHARVHGLEDAA